MENALTVGKENVVSLISENGIGDLIKPLSREILLFGSYVAGTSYLDDDTVLEEIKPGDRLILQREDNRYDSKAILVLDEKKRKVGYIPEKDNLVFSRLMDAGKLFTAKIDRVEPRGSFMQINTSIYLVDF